MVCSGILVCLLMALGRKTVEQIIKRHLKLNKLYLSSVSTGDWFQNPCGYKDLQVPYIKCLSICI